MSTPLRIIFIGYERGFLDPNSEASERLVRMSTNECRTSSIVLSSGKEIMREFLYGRVYSFSGHAIARLWQAFFKIQEEVKRARISGESVVLSAQDPFAAGLLAWKASWLLKVPYEVQEHGDVFSGYWEQEHPFAHRIMAWMGGWIIRRANAIRVVSDRIKHRLIERYGIKPERIFVRPVDSDLSFHLALPSRPQSSIPMIVAPCRFVKQKGLEVLLNACAELTGRGMDFRVRLVGTGPLEKKLQGQIESSGLSGVVKIEPWASQESIWGNADLFVLSSYYEGWGRTIVEAMAAHVPVVTTDVGCVGSLFRPQIDGRVVPVGKAGALADAIAEQLSEHDRREWMRNQACERVKAFTVTQHDLLRKQADLWRGIALRYAKKGIADK